MAASPEPVLHSIEDTVSRAAKAKFSLPEVRVERESINQFWKQVECGPVTYGPMKVTDREEIEVYQEAFVNDTKAQQSFTVKRTLTKSEAHTFSFTAGLKLSEKISLSTFTQTTTSTKTTLEEVTFPTIVPPECKVTSCLKKTKVSRSADFTVDVSSPAAHPFLVYPRSKLIELLGVLKSEYSFWYDVIGLIILAIIVLALWPHIDLWMLYVAVGAVVGYTARVSIGAIVCVVEGWIAKLVTAKDAFVHLPSYQENSAGGFVTCQLEGKFKAQGLDTDVSYKQDKL